jgi:hypothetical protein
VAASQTLGAAYLAGLRPVVRCLRGSRIGPVKVEKCGYSAELDLETLMWKCGTKYPTYRLQRFLKCPHCGGQSIEVSWEPGQPPAAHEAHQMYQAREAAGRY